MDKLAAEDVYTPSTPATKTFVERSSLTNQLVDAIRTPGKQIIVFGHSGSGKTTLLLNKLEQTREFWIKSGCVRNTTLDELVLDAFDKLGPFYRKEVSYANTRKFSVSLGSEYNVIKASIDAGREDKTSETYQRVLPPQLTLSRLISLMGEAGALWIVDDFHKLRDEEKLRFAQTLKLFVDAAADYKELKIAAIGAVDSAREVINYDSEMRNRVAEVHVPLMTPSELRKLISLGEKHLNCEFEADHKRSITEFSSGLASICHQLCLNACFATNLQMTSSEKVVFGEEEIQAALERYIADSSDTLKEIYDKAVRRKQSGTWDNCHMIIHAIAALPQDGAIHSVILNEIHKDAPKYPSGNLTTYLKQLRTDDRGEILRLDANSGKFSFANPFYRAYVQMVKEMETKQEQVEPTEVSKHVIRSVDDFAGIVAEFLKTRILLDAKRSS